MVDAENAANRTDYNLIYFVLAEKSFALINDETNQIDYFSDLFIFNSHGFAELLSAFVGVETKTFDEGLVSIEFGILNQLESLLIVPDLLDKNLLLEVIEISFYTFGHLYVESNPVERDESIDQTNAEDGAVLSI